MRKPIFLVFAMLLTSFALMAQGDDNAAPAAHPMSQRPNMTPEQRAKQATDRLNATAGLSKEQYDKIMEINKNFFTQREALRNENAGQSADNNNGREKMRAMAKERMDKINAILTPEQQQKVQEERSQHQPHQGGGQ